MDIILAAFYILGGFALLLYLMDRSDEYRDRHVRTCTNCGGVVEQSGKLICYMCEWE